MPINQKFSSPFTKVIFSYFLVPFSATLKALSTKGLRTPIVTKLRAIVTKLRAIVTKLRENRV